MHKLNCKTLQHKNIDLLVLVSFQIFFTIKLYYKIKDKIIRFYIR